jgi:ferric-dicitrate binding protein FerR (iron transport regulator)
MTAAAVIAVVFYIMRPQDEGVGSTPETTSPLVYRTGRGQQTNVTLIDGSSVWTGTLCDGDSFSED